MFFIGIFGIDEKQKQITVINNVICPACGALARFEILKTYSYFHIFFIPTFRWNTKYYVKPACCGHMYLLDPGIGREIERGGNPQIRPEHLSPVNAYSPYKTCPACRSRVESEYKFCPYCGSKF
ncbi:MAG TPA: zinc ribbon domain-containing protein [Ruminiclostridium sp.]|jgi:RNA polymerase subunit RPABC4/transcription elongation factor Spt4|nr:zinc ribbon domain-containing protein [Ruminiclostridium sp.]